MDYTSVIKEIAESILANIKNGLDTKSYSDKTFTCKITNKGNNKYKVLYCGNTYTVTASDNYEVDDYVRVCAPCNNWNDLFIVCKSK